VAAVSVVAALASLLTPVASSAASLPDLVVAALTTHTTQVARGSAFPIQVTTKNAGPAAAAASTTRFYLSADRLRGAGDRRLAQTKSVGPLGPGAQSAGTVSLRPATTTPEGIYFVIACADDLKVVAEHTETNNCTASTHALLVVPGRTSQDLIDHDLATGAITPQQALVDKVFAAFGDSRLPAKYHGDDGSVIDSSDAVAEAAAKFASASPQTKAILTPFLKAPAYPHTWENLATAPKLPRHEVVTPALPEVALRRDPVPHPSTLGEPGWEYYQHPKGVRIWYRLADQHMHSFARLLYFAMDNVWKLTTLMGRAPMSDRGPHPYVDAQGKPQDWGDGGSGDLDIYFADMAKPAVTQAYPPNCTDTPSFIVMDPNIDYLADTSKVIHILAHEFMHVLQFTYHYAHACEEYTKMDEAVAQWAIDYVSPHNDHEHYTDAFLPNPSAPLWDQSYDGWPFEQFLAHTIGPGMIPQVYAHTESSGPWEAVNAALPGGLAEQWPKFAIKAWNQPPETDSFATWDSLKDRPALHSTRVIKLGTKESALFPVSVKVGALAREYDVATVADDVHLLEFHNLLVGLPGAGIHALIQLKNGTWKPPADWTNEPIVTFCKDNPDENVKKIVLITTDSTFADFGHQVSPELEYHAFNRCQDQPNLDGTFTWTEHSTMTSSGTNFDEVQHITNEGSAVFHLVPIDPGSGGYAVEDSGESTFTYTYSMDDVSHEHGSNYSCTDTTTESASASGKFSTYVGPFGVGGLSAEILPNPSLNSETDVIAITFYIGVVVDIHNEGTGSPADTCDFVFDDQRDDSGPIIDFLQFKCEPPDVANGPYSAEFEGKWHNDTRTFEFACSQDLTDVGTTGNLTLTGQLTAS
jgi:hypothetical protein